MLTRNPESYMNLKAETDLLFPGPVVPGANQRAQMRSHTYVCVAYLWHGETASPRAPDAGDLEAREIRSS